MTPYSLWSFLGFHSIFQNVEAKWYFLSFHSCSCDVILPSFAYQDGGLHITISQLCMQISWEPEVILKNGQRCSFPFYQIFHLRSTWFWGEFSLWCIFHVYRFSNHQSKCLHIFFHGVHWLPAFLFLFNLSTLFVARDGLEKSFRKINGPHPLGTFYFVLTASFLYTFDRTFPQIIHIVRDFLLPIF